MTLLLPLLTIRKPRCRVYVGAVVSVGEILTAMTPKNLSTVLIGPMSGVSFLP